MPVNRDKPDRWKQDIAQSVDFYNRWFVEFAPQTYRETRGRTTEQVKATLAATDNLTNIAPAVLRANPGLLPILRMATAPPIARDRLIGLAGVSPGLVHSMESDLRVPPRMNATVLDAELARIGETVRRLADADLLPWLETGETPTQVDIYRAATVIADRLCGAEADPLIRNAQEQRQLANIQQWLQGRGYTLVQPGAGVKVREMALGTFAFRLNVPVRLRDGKRQINIPIDVAIKAHNSKPEELPLLVEAKSAGDYTNTNKRRKEEAIKTSQLRSTYGPDVRFILFLCGYFDSGYLGYEAAEAIDWVWEHRIDELAEFGV